MERATVQVYEQRAAEWRERRPPGDREHAAALTARCLPGRPAVDLGCGPGSYFPDLPRPLVAVDAAQAMLELARASDGEVAVVRADLEALPFRFQSLGGAWARASYLHVPKQRLPLALAHLHHVLRVGAPVHLDLRRGDHEGQIPEDDFPGRFFAEWQADELRAVAEGAGFEVEDVHERPHWVTVTGRRARSLPDFVAAGMRVLVCGLNPSLVAADAGYGYAGPSNRFWKAAVASGLMSKARDPWRAIAFDRVGMTCMVKRATPRAGDLSKDEYRGGVRRLEQLVAWLQPRVVLSVGLEGWRAAVDRTAQPGPQSQPFAGATAYVMPSTSGLNAHASLSALTDHMRAALALAAP